jgi:4'-phosphopantetheinyl transferase
MKLELNNTDIWYMSFKNKNIIAPHKLFMLLNQEEKNRANHFLKEEDKKKYIISHAYLRLLLTKYYPTIKPFEWEFLKNEYGKPSLSKKHNIKLFFNLSHTHSYMAIIVNKSYKCGIDIEEDKNISIDDNMINMVLSENEKKIYYYEKDKAIFYLFWTLKEAYLKALGMGLHNDPEKIDFGLVKDISLKKNKEFIKDNNQHGTLFLSKYIYLAYCVKNSTVMSSSKVRNLENIVK